MFSKPSSGEPNGFRPFPIVPSLFLLVLLIIGLIAAQLGISGSAEIVLGTLATIFLLVKTWMGTQKTSRKSKR